MNEMSRQAPKTARQGCPDLGQFDGPILPSGRPTDRGKSV